MRCLIKKIFIILLTLSICIGSVNNSFADANNDFLRNVTITGDSYANVASIYAFKIFGFTNPTFCMPGTTIYENQNYIDMAIRSKYRYVLFSIGVNDHIKGTTLLAFENKIREYCIRSFLAGKILIMHSYMHYASCTKNVLGLSTEDYDGVLQRVLKEYPHTRYIDLRYVNNPDLWHTDSAHPEHEFYEELFKKLKSLITMEELNGLLKNHLI